MLEIIFIVVLSRRISNMVKEKGLKPTKYVVIMVLSWVGLELAGGFIGGMIFGESPMAYLVAIAGAALGAFIGYSVAKNATGTEELLEVIDSNM